MMRNHFPFITRLTLFLSVLCAVPAMPAVQAEDALLSEPEGVVTDCEALWREEVPQFLEMEPDATFEDGDEMRAADVAAADDGSVYLLCNIASEGRLGPKIQTLLVKYDAEGERAWHRLLGENTADIGYSVAVGPEGNVYLVGCSTRIDRRGTNQTWGYVASYNARGRLRWNYNETGQGGTVPTQYHSLVIHGDSVYAVGSATGRVGPGARFETPRDAMVTRLRLNGRKQWTRQYQGETQQWRSHGLGITATPDGRVCITGLQQQVPGPRDRNPAGGHTSGFVLCVDAEDGDAIWRAVVDGGEVPPALAGEPIGSMGIDIDADASGNVYVVGHNRVGRRAASAEDRAALGTFVSKLSEQGEVVWTRYCPNQSTSVWTRVRARRIRVDQDGRVCVAGMVVVASRSYLGVLEYATEGEFLGALRYRSPGYDADTCFGIAFDTAHDGLLLAGVSRQLATRGGLFRDDEAQPPRPRGDPVAGPRGQRPAPQPREAKPPHYFVMRVARLEDIAGLSAGAEGGGE